MFGQPSHSTKKTKSKSLKPQQLTTQKSHQEGFVSMSKTAQGNPGS